MENKMSPEPKDNMALLWDLEVMQQGWGLERKASMARAEL